MTTSKVSTLLLGALVFSAPAAFAQINTTQTVVPGVYFYEGDPRRGHSNNGWIVFEDVVLGTDRFLRAHISATVGRDQPQAEHYRLLDACTARDERLALRLLEAHIEQRPAGIT